MRGFALILALLATNATAGQRIYEGNEVVAIRCANMMAMTGVTLNGAGLMRDRRDVDATLQDYQRNAPLCLTRFPIN